MMNFIRTLCETLHLSTFRSSCEKLAKLHSPFQMACQKVKMKLSPIPYYLKVVGIFIHTIFSEDLQEQRIHWSLIQVYHLSSLISISYHLLL